jgi:hypothetical protein
MGIPQTWAGFKAIECCRCGTGFAMESALYDLRQSDHKIFWCPNGHEQYLTGETPSEKRIAELERQVAQEKAKAESAQRSREWAEQRAKGANISAGKAKAAAKRLERRVNCGVCPHCRRSFKQLRAHMQAKHPEHAHE